MPLNAPALAADTVARLQAEYGSDPQLITGDVEKVAQAMAEAVVAHIQAFAVVNVIIAGSCPTGPVTGTGTGTVT